MYKKIIVSFLMYVLFMGPIIPLVPAETILANNCLAPVSEFNTRDITKELNKTNLKSLVKVSYSKAILAKFRDKISFKKEMQTFYKQRQKLIEVIGGNYREFNLGAIGENLLKSTIGEASFAAIVAIGLLLSERPSSLNFNWPFIAFVSGMIYIVPIFKIMVVSVPSVALAFLFAVGKFVDFFRIIFRSVSSVFGLVSDVLMYPFRAGKLANSSRNRIQEELPKLKINKTNTIDTDVVKVYLNHLQQETNINDSLKNTVSTYLENLDDTVKAVDLLSFIDNLYFMQIVTEEVFNETYAANIEFLQKMQKFVLRKANGKIVTWEDLLSLLEWQYKAHQEKMDLQLQSDLNNAIVYNTKTIMVKKTIEESYVSGTRDIYQDRGIGGYDSNNAASLAKEMSPIGQEDIISKRNKEIEVPEVVNDGVNKAKTAAAQRTVKDEYNREKLALQNEYAAFQADIKAMADKSTFNKHILLNTIFGNRYNVLSPIIETTLFDVMNEEYIGINMSGFMGVNFLKIMQEKFALLKTAA